MFPNWQLLCAGKIDQIDSKFAFPHLRWMSGKPENLEACAYIDSLFFKVPPEMIVSLLHVNCRGGFIKYPKKTKVEDNEQEELIKDYLCKIYGWSRSEYDKNKSVINEEEAIKEIVSKCGLNKKECKILGVEYGNVKKYKFVAEQPKPRGLDCFV